MSDFRTRMFEEHGELHQRIEKLEAFVTGKVFQKLPEIDRQDLVDQLEYMRMYFNVLSRRVSRQRNAA